MRTYWAVLNIILILFKIILLYWFLGWFCYIFWQYLFNKNRIDHILIYWKKSISNNKTFKSFVRSFAILNLEENAPKFIKVRKNVFKIFFWAQSWTYYVKYNIVQIHYLFAKIMKIQNIKLVIKLSNIITIWDFHVIIENHKFIN